MSSELAVSKALSTLSSPLIAKKGISSIDVVVSNGESLTIDNGDNIAGLTVKDGGSVEVLEGGSASNVNIEGQRFYNSTYDTWELSGGTMGVTGGTVSGVVLEGFLLAGGGKTENITVLGGYLNLEDCAVLENVTVLEKGEFDTYHGSASGVIIESGAQMIVNGGENSHIEDVIVRGVGGFVQVNNGGTLSGLIVESNGEAAIEGVVNGLTIKEGGSARVCYEATDVVLLGNADFLVENGGTATIVWTPWSDKAVVEVLDGGTATYLERDAAIYVLGEGSVFSKYETTVNGLILPNDGDVAIAYSGAVIKGQILNEGTLTVEKGVTINFSVDAQVDPNEALVTNWGGIIGGELATCTISITSDQEGVYVLAGNASSFANTVTVTCGSNTLGELTVGETLVNNLTSYALSIKDKTLTFTITPPVPDTEAPVLASITASTTAPTNLDVTVTAAFTDNVGVTSIQYRINGGDWTEYTTGVVMTDNGTVEFKASDAEGNVSDVANYAVTNIDKVAPTAPVASADVTAPTNGNVTVTATFSADSAVKQYSLDGSAWTAYATGVVVSDNGTVYFRGTDAAGNVSEITEFAVANIDREAPEAPVAMANVTAPTNGDVTVTATFSADSAVKQYSLDGSAWTAYTDGVVMSDNGTVYFRGTDAAGNLSEVTAFEVANIDKTAPAAPTATADVTAPTNGDVTVTATFSADSAVKEYSLDSSAWTAYTDGIVMSDNGTVYFRGTDAAGNISEVTAFEVANIDKVAPTAPTALADITAPTNGTVTVTATFSADSETKEYSVDSNPWTEYTAPIVMEDNGTIMFRGIDAVGNISDITEFAVANIDREAPEAPIASADITAPTNGGVTVTASFSADSTVKQYSLDGSAWTAYTTGVVMNDNGTVYFRGTDAAGNLSEVTAFEVTNIDKVAPEKPTAAADVTAPTNQDVTVTATFSADTAVKQFSLEGVLWTAYTTGIVMTSNGTVYFRGMDAAGNLSDVTSFAVTNIDKIAPEAPVAVADITEPTTGNVTVTATFSADSAVKEYSLDNVTWAEYTTGIVFSKKGTVHFRGTDAAGNVSAVTSYAVTNIHKAAPEAPVAVADVTAPTQWNVTVTATFSEDSIVKQYSLDGSTWKTYTGGIVITDNGTVYFRGIDVEDNVSDITAFAVTNIDRVAPDAPVASADITAPTNGNITVTAMFSTDSTVRQYSLDGSAWTAYATGVVMTDNGTVMFRGFDAAGNVSDVTSFAVTNIDKVAPTAPVASADVTGPTNGDVKVMAAFSEDSAVRQYSFDGSTWAAYTDGVVMDDNGTVYFRGTDAAGNLSDITEFTVANIDKTAPEKPTASADITTPTNGDVTVTATFSADSAVKQYSLDSSAWTTYTAGIVMADNGTIYFRGTDAAGNLSEVTAFEVANIDKVAPEKPTASADVTELTMESVTVTATFSADSAVREYSLDGETWTEYTDGVVFSKNGTVHFRGTDAAGNLSEVASYAVTNIKKPGPNAPVAVADVIAPTNGNVTVTATFSEDSAVKQYSLDGETWSAYTAAIVMTDNGTVYFRGIDAEDQVSDITTFEVANIDRAAPDAPVAAADVTAPTNGNVTVSASFSEDTALKEYSLDGKTWAEYTDGVVMNDNGTVYFRGTDTAGNISAIASYAITNIDRAAPVITLAGKNKALRSSATLDASTEDGADLLFSTDNETWTAYTGQISVTENGTYWFKATDDAGNTGTEAITFSNIDASILLTVDGTLTTSKEKGNVCKFRFTVDTPVKIKIPVDYVGDAMTQVKWTIYSISYDKKGKEKLKSLKSYTIKNGVLKSSQNILLSKGIEYMIQIDNNDKKNGGDFSLSVKAQTVYDKGDNSDNVINTLDLPTFNLAEGWTWTDWVGFGDVTDYCLITLDCAAYLIFDAVASDQSKISVYSFLRDKDGNLQRKGNIYKLSKAITSSALKINKTTGKYARSTSGQRFTAGTYVMLMQSTNAAKGGWADFTISLNSSCVFYPKGDNSDDDFFAQDLPEFDITANWEDWVGLGDDIDCCTITLNADTNLQIDVSATAKVSICVLSIYKKSDGSLGKKSAFSLTAALNKVSGEATGTKSKKLKAGTYVLAVKAISIKTGASTDYSVSVKGLTETSSSESTLNNTWKGAAALDPNNLGESLTGWIGKGNSVDYFKFVSDQSGTVSLTLDETTSDAVKNRELKLFLRDELGKVVDITSVNDSTYTANQAFAEGAVFYVGLTCANTNKYNTSYAVTTSIA